MQLQVSWVLTSCSKHNLIWLCCLSENWEEKGRLCNFSTTAQWSVLLGTCYSTVLKITVCKYQNHSFSLSFKSSVQKLCDSKKQSVQKVLKHTSNLLDFRDASIFLSVITDLQSSILLRHHNFSLHFKCWHCQGFYYRGVKQLEDSACTVPGTAHLWRQNATNPWQIRGTKSKAKCFFHFSSLLCLQKSYGK